MLVYHSSYNSSILNYNAIKNNFNQFLNRSKIIKYHRKEEEKLCRVSINRVNIEKNISRNVLLDQSSRFTPRRNHANLEYPIEKLRDRDKKFSLVTTLLRPVSTYSEARKFRTGKRTVDTLDRVLGSRDELCLCFQTRKNASWELARLSTIVQHRTISLFAVNIYIRELIKSRHARSTKSGCLVKKKKEEEKIVRITKNGGNDKVAARVFSCFPERIGGRGRNVFRDFDSRPSANRVLSRFAKCRSHPFLRVIIPSSIARNEGKKFIVKSSCPIPSSLGTIIAIIINARAIQLYREKT